LTDIGSLFSLKAGKIPEVLPETSGGAITIPVPASAVTPKNLRLFIVLIVQTLFFHNNTVF
jgi:hypothetical protein